MGIAAQWCFADPPMQEPNMAAQKLYGTLQFLGGGFLKLAGADVVSDSQPVHI